jgi:hypothetical protein
MPRVRRMTMGISTGIMGLEEQDLLAAENPCVAHCPYKEDIDPEALAYHPGFWEVIEGMPPHYCPLYALAYMMFTSLCKKVQDKYRKKRQGKPLPTGIPSMDKKLGGGIFGEFFYGLSGDEATKTEALRLASSWVALGKTVKFYFWDDTVDGLTAKCTELGYSQFPDFVEVGSVMQIIKLAFETQCDAIFVSPLIEYPTLLRLLRELAEATKTAVVGTLGTIDDEDRGRILDCMDTVITVSTGKQGEPVLETVKVKKE